MKNVLLILLGIFLLALLLFVSWVVVAFENWPLWSVPLLTIGVPALFYLLRFIRRGLYRLYLIIKLKVGERKASAVISLNQDGVAKIKSRWQSALNRLNNSSIRRFGKPAYALPWFMVLGANGSGKTTLLDRSRLPSMIPSEFELGIQGASNDGGWWYFDKAIVIEATSRYFKKELQSDEREEWDTVLALLAKTRFREGVSGIVITLGADRLIEGSEKVLEEEAQAMRTRIEEIIRLFDMRPPVYLVITKTDLIYGFDRWASLCTREQLNQAIGFINDPSEIEQEEESTLLTRGFSAIIGRLKQLRLQLALQGIDVDSRLLLFPAELDRLRPLVHKYLRVCFAETPYLERPFLRGIYLTSSVLSDTQPTSLIIQDIAASTDDVGRRSGFFIRDLFDSIFPRDRFLFLPTHLIDRWRIFLRNILIASWVIFFVLASAMFVISFIESRSTFNRIVEAYPNEQVQNSPVIEDRILVLLGMKKVVDLFAESERSWTTALLTLSPAVNDLQSSIRRSLVEQMRSVVLDTAILEDSGKLKALDPLTPLYGDAVQSLARRVSMRNARAQGQNLEDLSQLPEVSADTAIGLGSKLAQSLRGNYAELYRAFIAWSEPDDAYQTTILKENREALNYMVGQWGQYEWLLRWADAQVGKSVALRDFWLPSPGDKGPVIRGALTKEGWKSIKSLLDEVSQALEGDPAFLKKRNDIEQWYLDQRLTAWRTFTWTFGQGQNFLVSESNWRDVIASVNTSTSPVNTLISMIKQEFSDTNPSDLPEWALFINQVDAARNAYTSVGQLEKSVDFMEALNKEGRVGFFNLLSGKNQSSEQKIKRSVELLDRYKKWDASINELIKEAITGEGKALKLESDFFALPNTPEVNESKLHTAYQSFNELKEALALQTTDDEVVWQLLRLPLDMTYHYIKEQASCALQKDWERTVLWKTQLTTSAKQLSDQLYGEQGSVWNFVDGPARPFLVQRADSFMPSRVMESEFPFSPEFVPYLNRAVNIRLEHLMLQQKATAIQGKTASVTLSNQPVTVNKGAKEKPYAVIFTLQCSSGEVVLNNFNMASSRSFNWSPQTCGDVAVEVRIGRLSLFQRYPGPMGLPKFMADFRDGERKFLPSSFPATQKELEDMGVQSIRVSYTFSGGEEVQQLARDTNDSAEARQEGSVHNSGTLSFGGVPQHIAGCWTSDPQISVNQTVSQWISKRSQLPKKFPDSVAKKPEANTHHHKYLVPNKQVPTNKVAVDPKPTPQPISIPETNYYIQIGVFRSEENIRNIQLRLGKIGIRPILEDFDPNPSNSVKRIKVGPFRTREQAELVLGRIEKNDLPGIIVKR